MKLVDTYVGLGSNLGNKKANCLRALDMMDQLEHTKVKAVSLFYKTEPVGVEEQQNWYLNAVALLATTLAPERLMAELLAIERQLGRKRKKRWDSRTIDLDILLYGDIVINDLDLEIPHPRLHLRRFVLVPLADLAPDLVHPVLKEPIRDLLARCPREGQEVIRVEGQ